MERIFFFIIQNLRDENDGELKNRVYKYTWNGQTLENPTLILDLPAIPGPNHDGGKLIIGPDNYLYGVIGDLNHDGMLQNFPDGPSLLMIPESYSE